MRDWMGVPGEYGRSCTCLIAVLFALHQVDENHSIALGRKQSKSDLGPYDQSLFFSTACDSYCIVAVVLAVAGTAGVNGTAGPGVKPLRQSAS